MHLPETLSLRHVELRAANLLTNSWPPDDVLRSIQSDSHPHPIQFAIRDGDSTVGVDATNYGTCVAIRMVYHDRHNEMVNFILRKASEIWPSQTSEVDHQCEECWNASPCIGLRFQESGVMTETVILYKARGCGEPNIVILGIEEKIAFLRKEELDAFLVWVPNDPIG